jgi:hypothetical protein
MHKLEDLGSQQWLCLVVEAGFGLMVVALRWMVFPSIVGEAPRSNLPHLLHLKMLLGSPPCSVKIIQ